MKIALVQLDVNIHEQCWETGFISTCLNAVSEVGVDLVVFPEAMPFAVDGDHPPTPIQEARRMLAEQSEQAPKVAFIAGGYVWDVDAPRNASFLAYNGKVTNPNTYFKRRPYGEVFRPGKEEEVVRFRWGKRSVFPLICADVGSMDILLYVAEQAERFKDTPIVFSTYASPLYEDTWPRMLRAWAAGCGVPVVACGISGKVMIDGERYGGGGSGVFWPDGHHTDQPKKHGIYIVDLNADPRTKKMTNIAVPQPNAIQLT